MQAKIKKTFQVLEHVAPNGLKGQNIEAGTYELERIPNPRPDGESHWLVLKGTTIGMLEEAWKKDDSVEIIE